MSSLSLRSIKGEATSLNLCKDQYTTYYVGYGTTPSDDNDGLTRETSFATITKALTEAESGTKIYINDGTYDEKINITKNSIQLIGEDQLTTIIQPTTTGNVIEINASSCEIENLKLIINTQNASCILANGDKNKINNIYCTSNTIYYGVGVGCYGSHIEVSNSYFCSNLHYGIRVFGDYCRIHHNIFIDLPVIGIVIGYGSWSTVHNNDFVNNSDGYGIWVYEHEETNKAYHNNFINHVSPIICSGKAVFFENYYDIHSNIDNGFGVSTEPYIFADSSDDSPVITMNGWENLAIGPRLYKLFAHEPKIFPEDTDETVTFTAGGTADTFGSWVEIVDNNSATLSSKFASNDGHISSIVIESASATGELYLLEISYGTSKTVVLRQRFISATAALSAIQDTQVKSKLIPSGETLYYRLKSGTASATCTLHLRYNYV